MFEFSRLTLIVGGWASRTVLITRELIKKTDIVLSELWTAQATRDWSKSIVQKSGDVVKIVDDSAREIWKNLLEELEGEASEIVAPEQSLRVQNAAGEVRHVDAGECVDFSSVTAEFEGSWICEVTDGDIADDVLGLVWSVGRATVPIFGNPLLALEPCEITWLAGDTEKGLEVVAVKVSGRLLGGVVAHEVDDEIVRRRHNNNSTECTGELYDRSV